MCPGEGRLGGMFVPEGGGVGNPEKGSLEGGCGLAHSPSHATVSRAKGWGEEGAKGRRSSVLHGEDSKQTPPSSSSLVAFPLQAPICAGLWDRASAPHEQQAAGGAGGVCPVPTQNSQVIGLTAQSGLRQPPPGSRSTALTISVSLCVSFQDSTRYHSSSGEKHCPL